MDSPQVSLLHTVYTLRVFYMGVVCCGCLCALCDCALLNGLGDAAAARCALGLACEVCLGGCKASAQCANLDGETLQCARHNIRLCVCKHGSYYHLSVERITGTAHSRTTLCLRIWFLTKCIKQYRGVRTRSALCPIAAGLI